MLVVEALAAGQSYDDIKETPMRYLELLAIHHG
jgi:hypothetical protein